MRKSQFIAGLLSIGIYILIIGLLVLYFNSKSHHKANRYVKKNDSRIQISLASPKIVTSKKPKIDKPKKQIKPKHKLKNKKHIKTIKQKDVLKRKKINKKITKKESKKIKKVIDKKIVKKDINKTKIHKLQKQDLFANIKVSKKHNILIISDKPIHTKPKNNLIKITKKEPSASEKINNSLRKQRTMDKGVTNQYLAKVQEMLEDWPAQSDFAGQNVKVILYIKPNGMFEFEIKSASTNPEFNQALIDYLKQLQILGFGQHEGSKTYMFEANFVAKE